jgi:hypothetical protein
MWERWNSLKPDGSFGDVVMNSFNHYAYGAVGDWIYRHIAGIAPLEAGYRRFAVAPMPGGGLSEGGGSLESSYGRIETAWRLTGDRYALEVTVPPGSTAEVALPDGARRTLGSGHYRLTATVRATTSP